MENAESRAIENLILVTAAPIIFPAHCSEPLALIFPKKRKPHVSLDEEWGV
jgi:hypothetical protein